MKMSEFRNQHVMIDDWDIAEGSKLSCSCGWVESYSGFYKDNIHLFDEHFDAEAERAGIGHVPTVVNEWVDKMVENRRGWCRDSRSMEAENHVMNQIFNELYCKTEIMSTPDTKVGDIQYKYFINREGPL